jgi:hypothetical protein
MTLLINRFFDIQTQWANDQAEPPGTTRNEPRMRSEKRQPGLAPVIC